MYANRHEAGRVLASLLAGRRWAPPLLVVALPRGGVPVAVAVAQALKAPLDLLIVRKIGVPWQRELAMAAVAEGEPPAIAVEASVSASCGVGRLEIERLARAEMPEIERRRREYLAARAPLPVEGRTVILVDDGLATGTTARAALMSLRQRRPARLVLAVPVAPRDTLDALRGEVDELVCPQVPAVFHAVGAHYRDFEQVSDDDVERALRAFGAGAGAG